MARVSPRPTARKKAPARTKRSKLNRSQEDAQAVIKRRGIPTKDPPAPPAPPPRPTMLDALGLACVDGWNVDELDVLSVGELLAVIFDTGDADPALSLMRHISTDLTALVLAYADPEAAMRKEDFTAVLHRLSTAALVAGELHRREVRLAQGLAA